MDEVARHDFSLETVKGAKLFWMFGRKARARALEDAARSAHERMDHIFGPQPQSDRTAPLKSQSNSTADGMVKPHSAAGAHFLHMSGGHAPTGHQHGDDADHHDDREADLQAALQAAAKSPFNPDLLKVDGPGGTGAFLKQIRDQFSRGKDFYDRSDKFPDLVQREYRYFERTTGADLYLLIASAVLFFPIPWLLLHLLESLSAITIATDTVVKFVAPTVGALLIYGIFSYSQFARFRFLEEHLNLSCQIIAERFQVAALTNFHILASKVVSLCNSANSQQQPVRQSKQQEAFNDILTAQYLGRGADLSIEYASITLKKTMQPLMFENLGFFPRPKSSSPFFISSRADSSNPPASKGQGVSTKSGRFTTRPRPGIDIGFRYVLWNIFLVAIFLPAGAFSFFVLLGEYGPAPDSIEWQIVGACVAGYYLFCYGLVLRYLSKRTTLRDTPQNPVINILKDLSLDPGSHGHYFKDVADSHRDLWATHFGDKSISIPKP
jgi:hypothetical protein